MVETASGQIGSGLRRASGDDDSTRALHQTSNPQIGLLNYFVIMWNRVDFRPNFNGQLFFGHF